MKNLQSRKAGSWSAVADQGLSDLAKPYFHKLGVVDNSSGTSTIEAPTVAGDAEVLERIANWVDGRLRLRRLPNLVTGEGRKQEITESCRLSEWVLDR